MRWRRLIGCACLGAGAACGDLSEDPRLDGQAPVITAVLVTTVVPQEPRSGMSCIYGALIGLGEAPEPLIVPTKDIEIRFVLGSFIDDSDALGGARSIIRCGSFQYQSQPVDEQIENSGLPGVSSAIGADGAGPALVVRPSSALPANVRCTVELTDKLRTVRGEKIEEPTRPIVFMTGS